MASINPISTCGGWTAQHMKAIGSISQNVEASLIMSALPLNMATFREHDAVFWVQ